MAPLTAAQRQRFASALLWVVPLCWSSNYLIARAAVGVIAPHRLALALARWSLAFVLMLPLWPSRLGSVERLKSSRRALSGPLGLA